MATRTVQKNSMISSTTLIGSFYLYGDAGIASIPMNVTSVDSVEMICTNQTIASSVVISLYAAKNEYSSSITEANKFATVTFGGTSTGTVTLVNNGLAIEGKRYIIIVPSESIGSGSSGPKFQTTISYTYEDIAIVLTSHVTTSEATGTATVSFLNGTFETIKKINDIWFAWGEKVTATTIATVDPNNTEVFSTNDEGTFSTSGENTYALTNDFRKLSGKNQYKLTWNISSQPQSSSWSLWIYIAYTPFGYEKNAINVFDGLYFIPHTVNYYDGTQFVKCKVSRYDGTEWIPCTKSDT